MTHVQEMRSLFALGTFLVITAVLGMAGCSTTGTSSSDIRTMMKIRWPGATTLSADQTLYYVDNPEGVYQLYKVEPGKTQADAVKLTDFEDGIGGYSTSDDGRWIAITASVGGSEQSNLYLMDAATGEMRDLFVDPEVVYGGAVWRRDSKAFAFRANDESPRDFHVYLFDLASMKHKKVYAAEGFHVPVDFSSDGKKLVVFKYNSASYSQLFEIDLASGKAREITPEGESWSFGPIGYTADDKSFLVTTDYQGDLTEVRSIDIESGRITMILPDIEGYETDGAGFNKDRSVLAVLTNEDGYGELRLYGADSYSTMKAPPMKKGVVGNISFRDPYMLYSMNNANTPGIVYKWDYTRPDLPGVAVTEAETFGIDVSKFLLPELIHYESFDGQQIPAFLYLPEGYKKGERIPFLIYYHGGPEGQFRPYFARSFQYFMLQGFGLLMPNVRGSSGYGKAFIEADNYKNRYKSVKDGIWAARFLVDNGYSSQGSIGAWGGSYGGFMVMAMLTEAPELFGAGCDVVGIVNFETFLQQTADYRRHLREVEYGPLDDPEFLRSISPIYKVDRIKAPLMIAHGLNDPRVPIGEAMQIAIALKKRGQTVEELYFPDEGHGFAKEENNLLYYEQVADFFERHLKK